MQANGSGEVAGVDVLQVLGTAAQQIAIVYTTDGNLWRETPIGSGILVLLPGETPAPPPPPPPPPAQEDMLDWWINSSTTEHVEGTPPVNPMYGYKDPDGKKFWLMKSASGHPWDIKQYDATQIYFWITENGDQAQWTNASAYKRYLTKVPMCPRHFTLNSVVSIDSPGNNPVQRTVNCGADNQPLINIGHIRGVTTGPTSIDFLADVGVQNAITVNYYYSGTGTNYNKRERYFLVKGLGLVQWDVATLQSDGSYIVNQTSAFNLIRTGGPPAPVFGCTSQTWWQI